MLALLRGDQAVIIACNRSGTFRSLSSHKQISKNNTLSEYKFFCKLQPRMLYGTIEDIECDIFKQPSCLICVVLQATEAHTAAGS